MMKCEVCPFAVWDADEIVECSYADKSLGCPDLTPYDD